MVYDAKRDRVVVVGGDNQGFARLSDTWEYDGARWSRVEPDVSPPGRANINEGLVYDSARGVTVLYGGLGPEAYLSDTWEYDGASWRRVDGDAPPGRDAHAADYDAARGEVVLFGGFGGKAYDDTWIYNGAWRRLYPPVSPPARFHHSMAYDPTRRVIVLFGGRSADSLLGDTWEYDGARWRRVTPNQAPPARENHRLVFDPSRGIILFGGETAGGNILTDDWLYDGVNWRRLDVPRGPSARKAMGLVSDLRRERLLLFGGGFWIENSLVAYGDTWALPYHRRSGVLYLPTVLVNLGRLPGPKPAPEAVVRRKVLVLAVDPLLRNGQRVTERFRFVAPRTIATEAAAFFSNASRGRVELRIVDWMVVDEWPIKADGFRYDEDTYLAVMREETPYHDPDGVSYDAVVADARYNICARANAGEIDEVWMFGGPFFGYYESRLVGPGGYWYNSPPMELAHGCERLVPIMGFNYARETDQAIHSFGHRAESAMSQAFGSWEQNRTLHDWDRFGLVAFQSKDFPFSGCGSIHFPPNGTDGYDYGNEVPKDSICADFERYPAIRPSDMSRRPVTCKAWGCTHIGYLHYWFSHLPATAGCTESRLNDWWRYIFEPERPNTPDAGCGERGIASVSQTGL